MSELAVLYDPQSSQWLRFNKPVAEIAIHDHGQVVAALDLIEERVEQEGLFAAGFVSYEAASAFDDALQTRDAGAFPLLYFRLFADREPIELPDIGQKPLVLNWQAGQKIETFCDKVDLIRAAIARGETYQANLTFPLYTDFDHDPWEVFLQLVTGQGPGGGGYLHSQDWTICSLSPELFFHRSGDRLTMRPMKGTAPRGKTAAEDCRQAEALQSSAKDRAENIMILDMVRNDLGRLAPPGEVHTEQICSLERYPTVWQLTSTVSARSSASLAEIFQALFPCASITGAPKASTMQIIKRTEEQPRRIYTGAIGWLAPGRQTHFNVAIRTLLVDHVQCSATYGVGAGITWDSKAADEYQECLDKAAILFRPPGHFSLLETLRWSPCQGYFLLEEHLGRLSTSAGYFDMACDPEQVRQYLQSLAASFPPQPQRVRLLLGHDGCLRSQFTTIELPTRADVTVRFAASPVDSGSIWLYHKTTRRQLYDQNLAGKGAVDEVVLWNERGEVTECCTANLVVELDGELFTPALGCGLLPGTYRDFLLKRGIVRERIITREELRNSSRFFLINAVRKWRQALLVDRTTKNRPRS